MIYHFFPESMKTGKVQKLITNFHGQTKNVNPIRNLKQEFKLRLVLKKVQRIINFHQDAWLKKHIHMKNEVKKKKKEEAKTDFEKNFFKVMNNQVFEELWKMFKNIGTKKNYLVSESNLYTKGFS